MKRYDILFILFLLVTLMPIKLFSQSDILFEKILKENNFKKDKDITIYQAFGSYHTPNTDYVPKSLTEPVAGFIKIEHIPDLAQQLFGDNVKLKLWGKCDFYLTEDNSYKFEKPFRQLLIIGIEDFKRNEDEGFVIFSCIYAPNMAESYEGKIIVDFQKNEISWYIIDLEEETREDYFGRVKLDTQNKN